SVTPSGLPHDRLYSSPTRRSSDLSRMSLYFSLTESLDPLGNKIACLCPDILYGNLSQDFKFRRQAADELFILPLYARACGRAPRSEEHTSELQSRFDLVCRLLLDN